MSKDKIDYSYFLNTKYIWILLIICTYGVFACEFESLRISIFSINCDITTINKINNIIKNLSFSYIAGVVFFLLADTIPFLRRKKIARKNVKSTLISIIASIDEFSIFVNNKTWESDTDAINVFEEFTDAKYSEEAPPMQVQSPLLASLDSLTRKLNSGVSFVLSQELYLDARMMDDIEKIMNKVVTFCIASNSECNRNGTYVEPVQLVKIFNDIIQIKITIKKYM